MTNVSILHQSKYLFYCQVENKWAGLRGSKVHLFLLHMKKYTIYSKIYVTFKFGN